MKIAKKYHVGDSGLVEGEVLGRITVYLAADFERLVDDYAMVGNREHSLLTRIAELEQSEKQAQETVTLALSAGLRVALERDALQLMLNDREEQNHSLEQRRHAEQQSCQAAERDADRYRWLRGRNLETIHQGGVFAGITPENMVLNGVDLDTAVDAAIEAALNPAAKAVSHDRS